MSTPTPTPLDTFTRQRIQTRIDAIRANIRERDGREMTAVEVAKLRSIVEREIEAEAVA